MFTPAQQKRIDARLLKQEKALEFQKEQEKLNAEYNRQQKILSDKILCLKSNASLASDQFEFTNPFQTPRSGSVNYKYSGNGVIVWKCQCEPTVTFNDLQRLTSFLGTTDISVSTEVDVNFSFGRDREERMEMNWSLVVEFKMMGE
jgi:hypothetical protein